MKGKFVRNLHRIYALLFTLLGKFPKQPIFVFESFHGRQYSDNPRAIYEYVAKEYPNMRCIWAVKKGYESPFKEYDVPYVRRMGLKWLWIMPRAQYWVFNTRMPKWMVKTIGTKFIQTWHGTPLKKLGLDIEEVMMPGTDTKQYRHNFEQESNRWDILLSPNTYSSNIFRSAFGYDGEILEIGYPRNDVLVHPEQSIETNQEIRKKLGIKPFQKVILYAPTWRDDEFFKKGSYRFNNQFPFSEMLQQADEIVVLLRTHYLVSESIDLSSFNQRVINCSEYPDIRDLYLISDLLITDYSSVMFDFAFLKRPMIFYMYDYDKYKTDTRGFYFNPEKELPGPIVKNPEQLKHAIELFLKYPTLVDEKYHQFRKKYCIHTNEAASKRLLNELIVEKSYDRGRQIG